ncbi:alpha-L-fucosidase [Novipirellula artificiosorum]|uniref:alpha-L-fucosidase n=1 Tax=Novipirellula artificiosorum TaxID=2528016 RepID=A0A5C6E474_9BACT|nr:alpha-L-fucosidase [Novipirellula artificiosorum]TWU42787.1 Alpha-L-fucosidase [Novipirellula artificiosorum]
MKTFLRLVARLLLPCLLLPTLAADEPEPGSLHPRPFQANWQSLEQYECPDWFRDAKFGIYAHWGVYSASQGKRNTDWYGRNMYKPGHPNHVEHLEKFGPVSEFGYKDLVPLLTAEKFNADEWVDVYVQAGARFAGPVGEHADGFSMWDSKVNEWNAASKGPRRDVVAEMKKAVEKRGLKFLVSMHHSWHWGWFPTWDKNTDASDPTYASLYGPQYPSSDAQSMGRLGNVNPNMCIDPMPSDEWEQLWLDKINEVVTGYSPDLLWFDNRLQIFTERARMQMVSEYYNHALAQGQQPVLTYKRPDLALGTATVDLERSRMPDIYPDPWLTDTSISPSTWAFAADMDVYPVDRIVDDLVDIVSKNGCMLLNIAPAPDGTIPEAQKEILRGIGDWLRINGEAIYGSRPWLVYGEGPTVTPVGHLSDMGFDGFSGEDVRYTTNQGNLYVIALGVPDEGKQVVCRWLGGGTYRGEVSDISLVGYDGKINWKRDATGLFIEVPTDTSLKHALTFKVIRES